MRKMFVLFLAASFCGALWSAETTLEIKSKEDLAGAAKNLRNIPDGVAFTIGSGHFQAVSRKKVAVDLKKKYLFTFEYRLAPGSKEGCGFYVAPIVYDSKGRVISCESQRIIPGSDSVLIAPAKKGDRVIKVKDCSKWVLQYGAVAFNTKADLSDLPNMETCRIAAIKQVKEGWEVSLKTAGPAAYAAGVAVRNHRDGAGHRYVAGYIRPKSEWQKCSKIIQGALREGLPKALSTWRTGTASAGVILFPGLGKADVEVRNIAISEVK